VIRIGASDDVRGAAPLQMPFRFGIAVGRAYELLRDDCRRNLAMVQRQIGYRYCRFHGLFHDDMMVAVRRPNGELQFQWRHVDEVIDFLLSIGLKPFVELNSMPGAMASGKETFFFWGMNVTPPRDFGEWERLVEAFARHCVQRYGEAEVRSWYFEVWNEPNLKAFWTGTQEEYWRLYRSAARALYAACPGLQIGGPASAEGGWIPEFLDMVDEYQVPADFVSTHVYPMNEWGVYGSRDESPYPPGAFMRERVRELRQLVRQRRPGAEFHITEWNSLDSPDAASVDWFDNPTIDSIFAAAQSVRACVELDDVVDGMFWWVASDVFEEAGMPQSPYSGTYGMVTLDGIPKASFHAMRALRAMTGDRLELALTAPHPGAGGIATRDGDVVRALLWNHCPAGTREQTWSSSIQGPTEGKAIRMHIRPEAGSGYERWVRMGRPQNPTPWQLEAIRAAATPDFEVFGPGPIDFTLGPGEVALFEFAPASDPYIPKEAFSERASIWNAALADVGPE